MAESPLMELKWNIKKIVDQFKKKNKNDKYKMGKLKNESIDMDGKF